MDDDTFEENLTVLPASGYTGPVPQLPPLAASAPGLWQEWEKLWHSPQATQWATTGSRFPAPLARLGLYRARGIEDRDTHELAEAFGLTPDGMAALGWVIREVPDI